MRKAIGLALGCAALSVALSGVAHADAATEQFVADADAAGFINSDANLIAQGVWACAQLDHGFTAAAVVKQYVHDNPTLVSYQGGYFVGLAVGDLCPWHMGEPYEGSEFLHYGSQMY